MSKDTVGLVWSAFQSAALRWSKVRDDSADLAPAMRAMRDALDLADAARELFVRGDLATLAKLAERSRKAVEKARRSRELDWNLHERKRLLRDVTRLREANATPEAVVHRISMWPDLNVQARPDEMPVRRRRGRLTTPADMASAVAAVGQLEKSVSAPAVIERALIALGMTRDEARTVSLARRK